VPCPGVFVFRFIPHCSDCTTRRIALRPCAKMRGDSSRRNVRGNQCQHFSSACGHCWWPPVSR
jgi:hypothetical protein